MKSFNLIKPYFIKNWLSITIGLLALIIVDMLQLFIPRIIKWAIDDLTVFRATSTGLMKYAVYIVGLAALIGIFRYVWRFCLIGMSRQVEEGLRNQLFCHIQTLSASYFNKSRTGDLMAHATNDILHIRMATGMGMVALTDAIVLGAAGIAFMLYINVRLTLLVIIPMPLIVFGTRFFSKRMHRLYQDVQEGFSELTETVREQFAGIRIVKAYNMETSARTGMEKISRTYIHKNLSLAKFRSAFFPTMVFLSNLSLGAVLYFGGRQTIMLTITPGDFVAFISYLSILTWPMMAIGWVTNLIQRGKASLDRIDKIMETRSDITDAPDAVTVTRITNGICIEKAAFSYSPDALPALSDITIRLNRGSILGIIGPPGSGKTTLLSLLPRLFDVTSGHISIDGTDIHSIQIRHLRELISFVPQEPFLFAGTIRENITFGNDATTEDELIKAVKDASLYETIMSFSEGFETIVGEKGVILSGGQKQRVALARALLRKSPMLILDDPISQVDTETGNTIIQTIRRMPGRRTVIIVSHRLSAIRFADQIITLKDGKIVESGSHESLMMADNYYAKTYRLQESAEAIQ